MLFSNIWGRVLHVLVCMLLRRVTRVPMSQRPVNSVVVCVRSAHSKWRRCGERTNWVSFSWLRLVTRLANRAISIVGSVAKMSRCWRRVLMRYCDTIRGWSILPVTSDWGWKILGGGSWISKETPLVRANWSGGESISFEVLWKFGIASIPLPRISS